MEEKIKVRIDELLTTRLKLIADFDKQIFGLNAAIGELQHLLDELNKKLPEEKQQD